MASKAGLIGAKSRDAWKYWHKTQCPPWGSRFWGLDVDFVLVDKNLPRIIAVLDYKQPHDIVGFSEVIAYNAFIDAGMGVFIITAQWNQDSGYPKFKAFQIEEYLGGDYRPNPPVVQLKLVMQNGSEMDYWKWERKLRGER